jgi:hypothetical protein
VTPPPDLDAALAADGFAFVEGSIMRSWLAQAGALADWAAFEASWHHLHPDRHMADGGRDRRRHHAVFACAGDGAIVRQPHQPHWQGLNYNPLNGGVERWFEPIEETIAAGGSLQTVLRWFRAHVARWAPQVRAWHVEVHQFRIEAAPDRPGRPTPEGRHRDGVDFVLVLMIRRSNIERGTTTIHALDGEELGSFILAQPFDAALVEDARVMHGVTAVEPVDPARPAFRDVLVVTFRAA